MDQPTHTWIAVRAVGLLESDGQVPGLAKLLKDRIREAEVGAYLPDMRDAKLGSARTQNHIMKMKPAAPSLGRYRISKQEMLLCLGDCRELTRLLEADTTLDDAWWHQPYKADPPPGQHLANRAMALSIAVIDLLIFGNAKVAALVPGKIDFADRLAPGQLTRPDQAALFFFMLSHFVADACMPCHCDDRALASYDGGLHEPLEKHWGAVVGKKFRKGGLAKSTPKAILAEAAKIDAAAGIALANQVPPIFSTDVWSEVARLARGSFALSSIIADPRRYRYGQKTPAPFGTVFPGGTQDPRLKEIDRVVLHDAVLNVAMIWKNVWQKFKP